ncbi:hypothetical protein AAHC03_09200 [Spirometra sp. Aus1]
MSGTQPSCSSPSLRISMRVPPQKRFRRVCSVSTPYSHKDTVLEAILEEDPDELLTCSTDDTNNKKFFIENYDPNYNCQRSSPLSLQEQDAIRSEAKRNPRRRIVSVG